MKAIEVILGLATCVGLVGSGLSVFAADEARGGVTMNSPAKLTQAEEWAKNRNQPSWVLQDKEDKKKPGGVRSFTKGVARGTKKELGSSLNGMAKDMVFVFSAQDIDPYEKSGPPTNRPAIVLKFTMIDGSQAYLRRFPDNSFAIEDGYADGTVMVPGDKGEFIIKYPNGVKGRVVFQGSNILVYRPDKTITTFKKTAAGGYSITNDKLGYMGSARPDTTGVHYELGDW